MAAPRGPARPTGLLSPSTARSFCRRPPLDGRRRARPWAASHYCRPAHRAWPSAPCPEYASSRPVPRRPPSRPPALRSGPRGRREGPPGKEDYAPHNAPRQKQLTSGAGACLFRPICWAPRQPTQSGFFPCPVHPQRTTEAYSFGLLSLGAPFSKTRNPDGGRRRATLQCASALGIGLQKLQIPKCLALNLAAVAWSAA